MTKTHFGQILLVLVERIWDSGQKKEMTSVDI